MSQLMDTGRILIIDDDEQFRFAQKRILRRIAIRPGVITEILEAADGDGAMTILQNTAVDCILLDNDMPGGTGLFWLQKILAVSKDQAIVMLTGHGSEQLAVEAMKKGAMDYLVKGSITPEEMQRAILNAIEKIDLRRTIDAQHDQLMEADRQRVMIESLGAACHHIGQPATVISAYLQLMKTRETDSEMKEMIDSCQQASDAMTEILKKLLQVSQYRTVPYLSGSATQPDDGEAIINV
jgi:DNA-binding NarL/FixJ family response regulator